MMDFEQLYEHEFAESPKFKTWQEALDAQVKWNKELSGHRDRKRK